MIAYDPLRLETVKKINLASEPVIKPQYFFIKSFFLTYHNTRSKVDGVFVKSAMKNVIFEK